MNIYIMLSNDKSCELQPKIINFISKNLVDNIINCLSEKIQFRFIFNPEHILESKISHFNQNDIILWHPNIAGSNLELMKQYINSIVILQSKTIQIQKVSKNNPITENMAINHEFKILYLEPDKQEITNDDWQLVLSENHYTITIKKLIELITSKIA